MTSMLLGGIAVLFILALAVGLWVGVLGHRKAGRDGDWRTMLVALILISIGVVVLAVTGLLFLELFASRLPSGRSPSRAAAFLGVLTVLSYTILPLGLMLFSIGFALNGLKAGRIFARMKELEQVSDAMGEEISRLTSNPPRA